MDGGWKVGTSGTSDLERASIRLAEAAAHETSPSRGLLERTDLRPYYVVTPPYAAGSAGVRVLHLLAKALLRLGAQAYVVDLGLSRDPDPFLGAAVSVPVLTLDVARQHQAVGLEPVVVYPEVVHGNPLGAAHVVRYLLNHPGAMGGPTSFAQTDLLLAFSRTIARGAGAVEVLCIPPSDPAAITRTTDGPRDRGLVLAYASKFRRAGGVPDLPPGATEVTMQFPPAGRLVDYLSRASVLHVWEDTAVIVEALLCGCPVVVAPQSGLTELILDVEMGASGITFDPSPGGIERARREVPHFRASYESIYAQAWAQFARFVAVTQEMPGAPGRAPTAIDLSALTGHSRPRLPLRTVADQTAWRVQRRVAARRAARG